MFPLVVSFYTKESRYQLDAHHLIASCEKYGLECVVEGIDSWGAWELNCAYKPFFILEKLKQHQRPLLWVDVDAVFVQQPKLLKIFSFDFAAYQDTTLAADHPSQVRSGTVFVQPTEGGVKILRAWVEECQKSLTNPERKEEFWDQMALRDVLLKNKGWGRLPLSYIKILGHPVDEKMCKRPYLVHLQASRGVK